MILECYQCSSCYFEDKTSSTRIAPETISPPQPRIEFQDVLMAFVCIEMYDGQEELSESVQEFKNMAELIGQRSIVLCPNVHLSIDKAPENQAVFLLSELETDLARAGFKVHCVSFGYHKQFGMECKGSVGSVVGRRFYGSPEKQFLRLLTRLGVCPRETLPGDLPSWAKVLSRRQLKVMSNRKETYQMARTMLKEQLDTGNSELWTCMLFEGERQPMNDYLSELYEIIEAYPDVRIHRAMNLSLSGFSNAARFLFRKYPDVIEAGKLRIYNSTVRDIEFLLTPSEVLLAFPKKPQHAGSHAGEIAFGIYCKDVDFARNVIQWYKTFLVDGRFGWIRTESALNQVINELEEEIFQDKFQ
ncbi:MAG: threonyl-tRNA synthetase editing domain-containing protein [Phycisphaerae bacterium]|nr:threonyl-tRNA synthetase editing domain-containing protein [Phycisphaerae bacterium]